VKTRPKRWPAGVFEGGAEPDPRFSLANERTFLAWIRTTLALLAAAAAVDALDLPMSEVAQVFASIVLALTGLASAVQAWRGWANTERALRHRQPLPSNLANVVVVIGVGLVAGVLVVSSLMRLA